MSANKQKIIDIIQWILILFLVIVCFYIYFGNISMKNKSIETKTEETYIKIYESQKIKELEEINKALYDSISVLKNAESAIQVKYEYIIRTDTIKVKEFVYTNDSIYHYENNNDTIHTDIKIKANDLKWCKVDNRINDKFTIITQEDKGYVKTEIGHSDNLKIDKVDAWHRKSKWSNNFYYGPSVNVGYGVFHKKIDVNIGFGIGYKF